MRLQSAIRFVPAVLVSGAVVLVIAAGLRLCKALDDQEILESTRNFVGKPFAELKAALGPPGIELRAQEEFDRFSIRPQSDRRIYVYGGERGVACVVVDHQGIVVDVQHRGSPP